MQIPQAKPPKQSCLRLASRERVGIRSFYSYILYLIGECKDHHTNVKGQLFDLVKYLVLNKVCSIGKRRLHDECMRLIKTAKTSNPTTISSLIDDCPEYNEDEFYKGLKYINKTNDKTVALLLFLLELKRRSRTEHDTLTFKYTLEHIMPQNWEKNWKDVPIIGEDGNETTDEKIRSNAIYEIGNMTLLTQSLNSTVSNADIVTKIEGRKDKAGNPVDIYKGMRASAGCKITQEVIDKMGDPPKWDESNIRERTIELYNEMIDLFDLVKLKFSKK